MQQEFVTFPLFPCPFYSSFKRAEAQPADLLNGAPALSLAAALLCPHLRILQGRLCFPSWLRGGGPAPPRRPCPQAASLLSSPKRFEVVAVLSEGQAALI